MYKEKKDKQLIKVSPLLKQKEQGNGNTSELLMEESVDRTAVGAGQVTHFSSWFDS